MNAKILLSPIFLMCVVLISGCSDSSDSAPKDQLALTPAEAAAIEMLELHMKGRNTTDPAFIAAQNNYPKVRLSAGNVEIAETEEISRFIEEFLTIPFFLSSEWDHSEWDDIKIVHSSENKVHFALTFSRVDVSGNKYKTADTYWVVTDQDNHWGLKHHSSFVDESSTGGDVAEAEAAAIRVLERHIEARNNRDSEALAALNSYPLVYLPDVDLQMFQTSEEYIVFEETVVILGLDYSEWDHSEWDKIEVIQSRGNKVHIAAKLSQFDVVGEKYPTQDQFWVVTKIDDHWKIQSLSNFVDTIQIRE
jgi:hypothetical protein